MEIIVPIGISGSGKTRLYNMRYSDLTLVSPDLIRKELTGSISDQRKNKEVFEEVDRRVADLVKKGESFFYDATNVNPEFRKKFVEQFRETIPRYMIKHQVRPGMTGWAQINGLRGDTSIQKRIEYDLYYLENWTMGFDIKILFLTFFRGFINENAY